MEPSRERPEVPLTRSARSWWTSSNPLNQARRAEDRPWDLVYLKVTHRCTTMARDCGTPRARQSCPVVTGAPTLRRRAAPFASGLAISPISRSVAGAIEDLISGVIAGVTRPNFPHNLSPRPVRRAITPVSRSRYLFTPDFPSPDVGVRGAAISQNTRLTSAKAG